MEINSFSIKLTGKAELSEPLEIDSNYKVTVSGSVISSSDISNQDGSCARVFVFKPVLVEVLTEAGKTLKAKDVRKQSQKLRGVLFRKWESSGENIEFENFYEREMGRIIKNEIEE